MSINVPAFQSRQRSTRHGSFCIAVVLWHSRAVNIRQSYWLTRNKHFARPRLGLYTSDHTHWQLSLLQAAKAGSLLGSPHTLPISTPHPARTSHAHRAGACPSLDQWWLCHVTIPSANQPLSISARDRSPFIWYTPCRVQAMQTYKNVV